jgi:hypothetical protein
MEWFQYQRFGMEGGQGLAEAGSAGGLEWKGGGRGRGGKGGVQSGVGSRAEGRKWGKETARVRIHDV